MRVEKVVAVTMLLITAVLNSAVAQSPPAAPLPGAYTGFGIQDYITPGKRKVSVFNAPPAEVSGDICKKCLAGSPDPICTIILCQQPRPDAKLGPIFVPENVTSTLDFCKSNKPMGGLCGNDYFTKEKPTIGGAPIPEVDAQRGIRTWLEYTRESADRMRVQKLITKDEHHDFLDSYRKDQKLLRLTK